jgi:RES domain-containing protein
MILWRLTRRPQADLSGRGGRLADGRWHSRGRPIAAPDDLEVWNIRPADLPAGWRSREDICRPIGDDWLAQGSTALLSVPSAIVEVERNVLLNPRHRDAGSVAVAEVTPFGWDERLFP